MDNLTHSLIGAAAAEAICWSRARAKRGSGEGTSISLDVGRAEADSLRSTIFGLSILASNFPDADLLYASRLISGKLGYLLHHRGHTHTIGGIAIEGALILLATWAYFRWRKWPWVRSDIRSLGGTIFLGLTLHLVADSWNSYGVHPFWPFSGRWIYGDSIFIVEPMIWLLLLPFLIYTVRTRGARFTLGALWAGAGGLCAFSGYVPPLLAGAAGVMTVAAALVARSWRSWGARSFAAIFLPMLFVAGEVGLSAQQRRELTRGLGVLFPDARTLEVILSPLPANPICWSFLAVQLERNGDAQLWLRKGVISLFPERLPVSACPRVLGRAPSDLLEPVRVPPAAFPVYSDDQLKWEGAFHGSVKDLVALRDRDCRARAALRFIRAPFWKTVRPGQGGEISLGDLRYARGDSGGFSEIKTSEAARADCPHWIPGWDEPRADLW